MAYSAVNINTGKKCKECGKTGTLPNGFCLVCMGKKVKNGEFSQTIKKVEKIVRKKQKEGK